MDTDEDKHTCQHPNFRNRDIEQKLYRAYMNTVPGWIPGNAGARFEMKFILSFNVLAVEFALIKIFRKKKEAVPISYFGKTTKDGQSLLDKHSWQVWIKHDMGYTFKNFIFIEIVI